MAENWPAIPKNKEEVYTFESDEGGGNVLEHFIHFHRLKKWGGKVVIKGSLASAAVIFAHLPNACFASSSLELRYHRAESPGGITIVLNPLIAIIGRTLLGSCMKGNILKMYKIEWSRIPWCQPMASINIAQAKALNPEINICDYEPL